MEPYLRVDVERRFWLAIRCGRKVNQAHSVRLRHNCSPSFGIIATHKVEPTIRSLCTIRLPTVLVAIRPLMMEGEIVRLSCGTTHFRSSYIRSIVLLVLLITTSICIDCREQLVDSPGSLMLRYNTFWRTHTHTHKTFFYLYKGMDEVPNN